MKSRSWFLTLSCTVLVAAFALSCGGEENIGELDQAAKVVCDGPTVLKLHGLFGTQAGTVTARNNAKKFFVTYKTSNGWKLERARVHIAQSEKKFPLILGNMMTTKFKYKKVFAKPRIKYTQKIKLPKAWRTPGTTFYMAAFAVVAKKVGSKTYRRVVWAGNMINKYTVGECYLDVSLPPGAVTMVPKANGSASNWILNLKDVPDGYDVWNGAWNGWCVEKLTYMSSGKTYKAKLVSSQDTANLPDRAKNVNWQLVNYALNHKNKKASVKDVQNAIWSLLGYISVPTDPEAKAMVLDAKANGQNFRPKYGDDIAVIFLSAKGVQLVFLEVSP